MSCLDLPIKKKPLHDDDQIYTPPGQTLFPSCSAYSLVPRRSLDTSTEEIILRWESDAFSSAWLSPLVSPQVDLLLVLLHFLLIVPLYVLLGRCSVILSRAGCLYDPQTEIWLAGSECLSLFPFTSLPLLPSAPLLRSSLSPLNPPSAAFLNEWMNYGVSDSPHPRWVFLPSKNTHRGCGEFFYILPWRWFLFLVSFLTQKTNLMSKYC